MIEDDQSSGLADFLARHVKPYDPAKDDYERPPFAADIKEGKNDPIYNAQPRFTLSRGKAKEIVRTRGVVPYCVDSRVTGLF